MALGSEIKGLNINKGLIGIYKLVLLKFKENKKDTYSIERKSFVDMQQLLIENKLYVNPKLR